ncbi:MAG: M1 family peptidase, partial [Pseudomonadota bacterium]
MMTRDEGPENISKIRDREAIKSTLADEDPTIVDFYTGYDPLKTNILDEEEYQEYLDGLTDEERAFVESGKEVYELTFTNVGGLVMPVIFNFVYEDGTTETVRVPAEIWRFGAESVTKVFQSSKP